MRSFWNNLAVKELNHGISPAAVDTVQIESYKNISKKFSRKWRHLAAAWSPWLLSVGGR